MSLEELLKQTGVEVAALPPAPASPTSRQVHARIAHRPPYLCAVCGKTGAMARVVATDQGARWADLCIGHGLTVMEPSPRMPTTAEGILADLREVVAEMAAETGRTPRMRLFADAGGWRDEAHG
ncbi:hypothetical protein [Streptomyces sp. NPDC020489]|uniref:hypothetical protein n=1 Tax=Streptomyces sp. NPDC020489 TaxID=3365077 RepID=UPI0037BD26E4